MESFTIDRTHRTRPPPPVDRYDAELTGTFITPSRQRQSGGPRKPKSE